MPFDNTPLGPQRLRDLAARLREPFPEGFVWDFGIVLDSDRDGCGTVGCAVGYEMQRHFGRKRADRLMGPGAFLPWVWAADYFETSAEIVDAIFFNVVDGTPYYGCASEYVTPLMVADAIDHWLTTGTLKEFTQDE